LSRLRLLTAGVDGGQSSTRAAIADDGGRILGRGTGPPADLVGEQRDSDRQRAAIAHALDAARSAAEVASGTRLAAVVIGLTGHDGNPHSAPAFAPFADAVLVVHDAVIAHAGAFGGEAGIIVLAGTGSVAVGNAERGAPYVRAGGWGYFFGDRGSALGIAREAIAWAMNDADRGEPSQLGEAALRFFGASDLREIQRAFAHGELSRPRLAAFAAHVMAMVPAEPSSTPTQAWYLRNMAANELAEMARAVDGRLPPAPVRRISYAGGVFRNKGFLPTFRFFLEHRSEASVGETIRSPVGKTKSSPVGKTISLPVDHSRKRVALIEPAGDPVDGALLLARGLALGKPVGRWTAVG